MSRVKWREMLLTCAEYQPRSSPDDARVGCRRRDLNPRAISKYSPRRLGPKGGQLDVGGDGGQWTRRAAPSSRLERRDSINVVFRKQVVGRRLN